MPYDFPLTVEALDKVPEEFRPCYAETDDGITLIEPLAKKVADLGGLSTALNNERKAHKATKTSLTSFTALSKTPDELKGKIEGFTAIAETPEALQALLADKDKLIADKGGDYTKQIEQVRTAKDGEIKKLVDLHTKAIEEKDRKITRAMSAVEREMRDSALIAEIAKQKGISRLLLPIARSQVRVVEDEETGEFHRKVVDSEGTARLNSKGEEMSIAELITEMRTDNDLANAFEGEGRAGGGSQNNGGGGGNRNAKIYTLAQWQETVGLAKPDERQKLLRDKGAGKIVVRN